MFRTFLIIFIVSAWAYSKADDHVDAAGAFPDTTESHVETICGSREPLATLEINKVCLVSSTNPFSGTHLNYFIFVTQMTKDSAPYGEVFPLNLINPAQTGYKVDKPKVAVSFTSHSFNLVGSNFGLIHMIYKTREDQVTGKLPERIVGYLPSGMPFDFTAIERTQSPR